MLACDVCGKEAREYHARDKVLVVRSKAQASPLRVCAICNSAHALSEQVGDLKAEVMDARERHDWPD